MNLLSLKKVKISVRINRFNYELLKDLADVAFREDEESEGNFSKALDFLLNYLRNKSDYKFLLKLLAYKAQYDRGDRSKDVLDGMKNYTKVMKSVTEVT